METTEFNPPLGDSAPRNKEKGGAKKKVLKDNPASVEGPQEVKKPNYSLYEKSIQWRTDNPDKIKKIKDKKLDGSITGEYGAGAIKEKFKRCAGDINACSRAYLERLAATDRSLPSPEQLTRVLAAIVRGEKLSAGADIVLAEEMTQEAAYADFLSRKAAGEVTLGGEAIAGDILLELDVENTETPAVTSLPEAHAAVDTEIAQYVKKEFITSKEAVVIQETVRKFGECFVASFVGKRFPNGAVMTEGEVIQRAYETMRDNARKLAYQTKKDKNVFSGSDHGTRHICEGNTHFAEQMMASMKDLSTVDFEPQDEVMIRQITIDHDIGYTADAAQAKNGFEASKDHPCAGCDFIESNKDYYVRLYGEEGYQVARDVILNHSYVQSTYDTKRNEAAPEEITYNRDLIRSVVSTVDAMGVTAETKAMDLFRYPESVEILQDIKLYAETHDGKVDDVAMKLFKEDLNSTIDSWLKEVPPRISQQRARAYHDAVEKHFNPVTVEIALGQYTGIVREVKLASRPDGTLVPEIHMDISQLAAIVGNNFGDKFALKSFVKAMEDFGLTQEKLGTMAALIRKTPESNDKETAPAEVEPLIFKSDRATFVIGRRETTGLTDEREDELRLITKQFERFERETVRSNIHAAFDRIRQIQPEKRTTAMALEVCDQLMGLFELDDEEAGSIEKIKSQLIAHIDNDQEVKAAEVAIKKFRSREEKNRLGKYEAGLKRKES